MGEILDFSTSKAMGGLVFTLSKVLVILGGRGWGENGLCVFLEKRHTARLWRVSELTGEREAHSVDQASVACRLGGSALPPTFPTQQLTGTRT